MADTATVGEVWHPPRNAVNTTTIITVNFMIIARRIHNSCCHLLKAAPRPGEAHFISHSLRRRHFAISQHPRKSRRQTRS
jgi:hypothetical protein